MTARHLLGLLLVAIGKRVALYGMRLADVAVLVMVRRPVDGVSGAPDVAYPAAWASAHEQPRINTVPPREVN